MLSLIYHWKHNRIYTIDKDVPVQRILDTRADLFMETFRLVDLIIHPQFAGIAGDVKPGSVL